MQELSALGGCYAVCVTDSLKNFRRRLRRRLADPRCRSRRRLDVDRTLDRCGAYYFRGESLLPEGRLGIVIVLRLMSDITSGIVLPSRIAVRHHSGSAVAVIAAARAASGLALATADLAGYRVSVHHRYCLLYLHT